MPTAAPTPTETLSDLLPPLLSPAYRVALQLTQRPSDAEEIVREAALHAGRAFGGRVRRTDFRAWFLGIVTDVVLSRCRASPRAVTTAPRQAPLRTGPEEACGHRGPPPDAPDAGISPFDAGDVLAALAELPIEERTVTALYFSDHLSYRELATVVGCPVDAVRSRLHRGRRHLQRRLAALAAEGGPEGAAA